jgi:hypothetical protein
MKKNVAITENQIEVKSHKWALLIFSLVGAGLLAAGLLFYGSIKPQDDLLIGFGIIFGSGGMFFFINSRGYRVVIDALSRQFAIYESGPRKEEPTTLPFAHFQSVMIQRKISGENSKESGAATYEVMLMTGYGSTLLLSEFSDKNKAMDFGKHFQDVLKIDLLLEDDAFRQILTRTKQPMVGMKLELPKKSGIKLLKNENETTLTWKSSFKPMNFIFLTLIMYGFFHVINYAVVPQTGGGFPTYLLYGFFAFISIAAVAIAITTLLGRYQLSFSSSGLVFYVKYFGKKAGMRSIERSDVGLVRNTIGTQSGSIQIVSKKGLEAMKGIMARLQKQESAAPDFSIIGDFLALKDEFIDVFASSLSMKDKLFLEDMILRGE